MNQTLQRNLTASSVSTYPNVLDVIGQTPLIRLGHISNHVGFNVYGKAEFMNPGGSIKDRTSINILMRALERREIDYDTTIIESSSGNMAIGLAQACKFLKLSCIVVVDPKANPQTVKLARLYGAQVEVVDEPCPTGGYLGARLSRVQDLLAMIKNSYWTNQYSNPDNPNSHDATMREIEEQLGSVPDYMMVATSTCGTIMGCADYINENDRDTQVIAVDAVGSVLFGDTAKKRHIPGHGASVPSKLLKHSSIDQVVHVTDQDCVRGCHFLLDQESILAGGSSGGMITALRKLKGKLPADANLVFFICDRGERYLDTIYNPEWVKKTLLKTSA